MAKGAELAAGGCPDHTIYVWPSRELVAQSRDWPQAWHEAFEQAAYELSGMVATCVLGGLPVTQQPIEMQLSAGWIRFRVACCGTRIDIDIVDFEGPDAPGPSGGTRRPQTADELVLGVRGSGKAFTMVTFYGPLPPIPAGHNSILRRPQISALRICIKRDGSRCLDLIRHPSEHNNNCWTPERLNISPLV
jgi:hypothetical protein